MAQTATVQQTPTVAAILASAETPKWIKDSLRRLKRQQPIYSACLWAIHDLGAEAANRQITA